MDLRTRGWGGGRDFYRQSKEVDWLWGKFVFPPIPSSLQSLPRNEDLTKFCNFAVVGPEFHRQIWKMDFGESSCLSNDSAVSNGSNRMSWPGGQGIGLAIVWSSGRILTLHVYGGTLVVWPGMLFPNRWYNISIPIFRRLSVEPWQHDIPGPVLPGLSGRTNIVFVRVGDMPYLWPASARSTIDTFISEGIQISMNILARLHPISFFSQRQPETSMYILHTIDNSTRTRTSI